MNRHEVCWDGLQWERKADLGLPPVPEPVHPFDHVEDETAHVMCGQKWTHCQECLAVDFDPSNALDPYGEPIFTRMLAPPDEICHRMLAFMRSLDALAEKHPGKSVEFDWEKNEIVSISDSGGWALSPKNSRLVVLRGKQKFCNGQQKGKQWTVTEITKSATVVVGRGEPGSQHNRLITIRLKRQMSMCRSRLARRNRWTARPIRSPERLSRGSTDAA